MRLGKRSILALGFMIVAALGIFSGLALATDITSDTTVSGPVTYIDFLNIGKDSITGKISPITVKYEDTVTMAVEANIYDSTVHYAKAVTGTALVAIGNSDVTFDSTLDLSWHLSLMDGPITSQFNAAVTAGGYQTDTMLDPVTKKSVGSSNNVFNSTLTLTDYDIKPWMDYSFKLWDGTNTFKKEVKLTCADSNTSIMKSTNTFQDKLTLNGGEVFIGYDEARLLADINRPGNNPTPAEIEELKSFYNQEAKVILASNSASPVVVTAKKVNLLEKGVLELQSNASVKGDIAFATGSYFAPNGNTLDVTGAAEVSVGAILTVDPAKDIGKTVLSTGNGITGSFISSNVLYKTELDAAGKAMKVTVVNSSADVIKTFAKAGVRIAPSAPNAMKLLESTIIDPNADSTLRTNLSTQLQQIQNLASSDSYDASIALAYVLGGRGVQAVESTRSTAQSYVNGVFGHLAQLRNFINNVASIQTNNAFGMITPEGEDYYVSPANRIWAGGFGAWSNQDDRDGEFGYKYDSGGFILGYDRQIGALTAGLSSAYSHGRLKGNEGFSKDDVNTFNIGLYASYDPRCSGFYAEGNIGFGYSWNDMRDDAASILNPGSYIDGKYNTYSLQAGGNVGYAFALPSAFRIIPTVGLQYTYVKQNSWEEKGHGTGAIAHTYDSTSTNYVEIPLAVRVNKTFNLGNCTSITPEVRGAWICNANDGDPTVRMGYVGGDGSTNLFGVNPGRSRGLIGAGVKAKFNNKLDTFLDYNFEFRSGFTNHNLMAGLGFSF